MTRSYRIYSTAFATAAAATYIVCQRKGRIIGAEMNTVATTSAGGSGEIELELSLSSQSGVTTNDAVGGVAAVAVGIPAASQMKEGNAFVAGLNIPIEQADRVYLHLYASGNIAANRFVGTLFVEE